MSVMESGKKIRSSDEWKTWLVPREGWRQAPRAADSLTRRGTPKTQEAFF